MYEYLNKKARQALERLTGHLSKKRSQMKHNGRPAAPARETTEESLKNLRDVSHIHDVVTELLGDIRRDAAKKAHGQGATLRQMGEAMGRHHTSVKALIDGTAA